MSFQKINIFFHHLPELRVTKKRIIKKALFEIPESKEVVTNQTVKPPFNERVIKKNDW